VAALIGGGLSLVPVSGSTSAVEESASASPSAAAACQVAPSSESPPPISAATIRSSAEPMPNTCRRIAQRRRKDRCRPIVNSSRMIPTSAIGSIAAGFEIVT
jgi:hypothetical protein